MSTAILVVYLAGVNAALLWWALWRWGRNRELGGWDIEPPLYATLALLAAVAWPLVFPEYLYRRYKARSQP